MDVVLIIIMLTVSVISARCLTTFVHEMGHCIPNLIFTKGKISIFIGSYGNPEKSFHITLGRLQVYFRYNPFQWDTGQCQRENNSKNIFQEFVIILSGPIASIILAIILCLLMFHVNMHISFQLLIIFFLSSALYDLYGNLSPSVIPIKNHDCSYTFNDGRKLQELIRRLRNPEEYSRAVDYYNQDENEKAAEILETLIASGKKKHLYYRLLLSCYTDMGNMNKALEVNEVFRKEMRFRSEDYCTSGFIYGNLKNYKAALEELNKAISKDESNITAYYYRGLTYLDTGEYKNAEIDFTKVTFRRPSVINAFNERGVARTWLGKYDDAYLDLRYALSQKPENAYYHYNMGVFRFEVKQFEKAVHCFEKAMELDPEIEDAEDYIQKAKEMLSRIN